MAATNASSFARAAPEAIDARAWSMPSAIEFAMPLAYSAVPALSVTISRGVPSVFLKKQSYRAPDRAAQRDAVRRLIESIA